MHISIPNTLRRIFTNAAAARDARASGFTLVELLTVMAIIGLIAAFVVPSASSILKGSQLTQSTQIVTDQLGLARQRALSRNRSVEVRFYKYGDPEIPGQTASNGNYRAFQTFEVIDPSPANLSGTTVAFGKVQHLQSSIIIDAGTPDLATLSSIFNQTNRKPLSVSTTSSTLPFPHAGNTYEYTYFRFRPDGSTDLLPTGKWYLTLHSINDGDKLTTPPRNFVTLQLDPVDGSIRTFRP